MDRTPKTALVIAFAAAILVLLFLGGGMMIGTMSSGGMLGSGNAGGSGYMGGIRGMWIPTLVILGLGALLAWVIVGRK